MQYPFIHYFCSLRKLSNLRILKYIIYTIGFIYLLISFNYGINIYDEGLVLVGGMRVLSGDIPYLDFWTIYSPGVYYFSAVIQLFSEQIWLHKFVSVVINFVIAIQLNSIFNLLTGRRNFAVFIASIIFTGFGLKYIDPASLGLMIALFSAGHTLKYFKTSDERHIFYSGLLIGLTSLVRHDFAVYLFIPVLLSLLFDMNKENLLRKVGKLILGLLPAVLVYIILGAIVGYSNMIQQIIVFPLTEFSITRALPFPLIWEARAISDSVSNYVFNLWLALVFLLPPVLAILNYILYRRNKHASLFIYYGLLVLLFYNQALNRSDYSHLLPSLLLSLPLLFAIVYSMQVQFYRRVAVIVVTIVLLLMPIGKKLKYAKQNYKGNTLVKANLDRMDFIYIEPLQLAQFSYLAELNSKIIQGESTFIGLKNMKTIEVNNVLSYYILGLKPVVKYHELHPGIADRKSYQTELLYTLFEKNRYVILLDMESKYKVSGDDYFRDNLETGYQYIIKSRELDLMVNRSVKP